MEGVGVTDMDSKTGNIEQAAVTYLQTLKKLRGLPVCSVDHWGSGVE